jgi:hypothetical protein
MRFNVGPLPDDALAASAAYNADVLPRVLGALEAAPALTIVFAPAPHDHQAWRLAAVQTLARACAPRRINAVASADEAAISATLAYIAAAPGLTGQLFALDGAGAGPVI